MKVRQVGRVVSVAVRIAVAVDTDGFKEIEGVPSEAEPFWTKFLRDLTRRGYAVADLYFPMLILG